MLKLLSKGSRIWLQLAVVFCLGMPLGANAAENPAPQLDDVTLAQALFDNGNFVGALPIYERLAQKDPQSALFAERLSYALVAQFTPLPAGEQRKALVARARTEAQRAKSLGDNSNLLLMLVEYLQGSNADSPTSMEQELAAAEAAFGRGEYDKALAVYEAVAAANPMSYGARLYAGDVHYIRGDLASASRWFQAAIDLAPNIETAHRYWGDALAKAGREDEALRHYINAMVAEPYSTKSRAGLQQWAERNRVKLRRPNVPVPAAPATTKTEDGKTSITLNMNPDALKNPRTGPAWLLYSLTRGAWVRTEFARRYPQEKQYRHSLAEEAAALRQALGTLKVNELDLNDADKEMRDLVTLGKADMIEPYILLQAADAGIAQDYNAYRALNRDKLAAYIRQFVVAPE